MAEVIEHPLIDEILEAHRSHDRGQERAWQGYRSHAHRIFNLARSVAPGGPDRDEKLAITAAFHDIDAFSSLDYLTPSIDTQTAWLARTGRDAWIEELAHVAAFHHKPIAYRGRWAELAEPFRRGDWCEVTGGLRAGGIDRELIRAVKARWSVSGFLPQGVARVSLQWVRHHPLDPAPILFGRRALERRQRAS